jgi:hypothetical protein
MELKTPASWMEKYLALVHQFNADIIGLPIPDEPTRLNAARKDWAWQAMQEELLEFQESATLEDEVDALIDLCYFALGRIIEMGVVPGAAFEEVHAANMAKVRGELSKRSNSLGYDAVKPEGWTPPYLLPYLALPRSVLLATYDLMLSEQERAEAAQTSDVEPGDNGKPKVIILGYARHGKDTVAEILQQSYGLTFTSSSLFCAERVIWAALHNHGDALDRHEKARRPGMSTVDLHNELEMMSGRQYPSFVECFADRDNFRAAWFSLIAAYCYPEKERLAREIFAENDIYVGIRNKSELNAVLNAGLADLALWVDASDRIGREPLSSCTVEPWMAMFTIDNNGSAEDLHRNVHQLMATLGLERIDE